MCFKTIVTFMRKKNGARVNKTHSRIIINLFYTECQKTHNSIYFQLVFLFSLQDYPVGVDCEI